MITELLAASEARLRPLLTRLPPSLAVRLYSLSRRHYLSSFVDRPPHRSFDPHGQERTLWGLQFRSPLFNAAGMFKNGEGYWLVARQGAGAYLAGTTTHRRRSGNRRHGVAQPFTPYPRSGAASNWLGLPNVGHRAVARRLKRVQRRLGCPVGVSAAICPDPRLGDEVKLEQLTAALELYEAVGVDFLEINESCPNTADDPGGLEEMRSRLATLAERFLARRQRPLPVIVKLSCDTAEDDVSAVVKSLVELGYDGVNFGNTSVDYPRHRAQLEDAETALYDYFTRAFGGGVSGRPLKEDSLRLVSAAAEHLGNHPPEQEFHIIRTGGIEDAEDVRRSLEAGASLCQWYTGYFEAFSRHGHDLYRRLHEDL
ncbi:MAG: hypothetical protein GY719_05825 [bacterium]|nr:hypothetical protein [bacterium]